MAWLSKSVLVVGGAGYIGSHTCKLLARQGVVPVAYDNLVHGHRDLVKWGPLEQGSIEDSSRVFQVLQKYAIDSVIHFAAYAYVGESVRQPEKYYLNNVMGTLRLLQACREAGVRHFVFSSTCATYGLPKEVPIIESSAQSPVNPYGQSKLMVEKILSDYATAYGFRSLCLRYFNASGCDLDGETGERHNPETHLIPLALLATLPNSDPLTVFGNDYNTPDGSCIRDYVHVTDIAQAHLNALKKLQDPSTPAFQVYNLGTGRGNSVFEILAAVEKVTGRKVRYKLGPRREGDPPVLVASNAKAFKELGWKPAHSDLETILETAWNWFRKEHGH